MRILGNNCLLEALPAQERTAGVIVLLPENVTDKKQFWRVLAVGLGRRNKKGVLIAPDFAVGQTVITPLHFSHFTFDDRPNQKIVDCDHIEARIDYDEFYPDTPDI